MQNIPLQQSVCQFCALWAILWSYLKKKKKKLILFALSITFIDKNFLTQKHVACVVKSCLTWDRKSVCQFEQSVVNLILYITTSIEPALNLFCSVYTSVMHLRPCASFQY